MSIVVNGERHVLPSSMTMEALLHSLMPKPPFAAALNGGFIPASDYGEYVLNEGDRIEIVHPSAGG